MTDGTKQSLPSLYKPIDANQWIKLVSGYYDEPSFLQIKLALSLLKKYGFDYTLTNGINCYQYGIQMADVLFQNKADAIAISAAFLLELFCTKKISIDELSEEIDSNIISVLKGVEKMSMIRTLQNVNTNDFQVDKYRKMLLTIIEDIRIVLVKLAERTCFLRLTVHLSEQYRQQVAGEILDIYAPLANRLGLYAIKSELEDKALFFLQPLAYNEIKNELKLINNRGEESLDSLIKQIKDNLFTSSLKASISGRVKHIYSVWKKMNQKSYDFNQLYDIKAIRVLVDTIPQCYQVLSIVHECWVPIQSEYTDYISKPKKNGYQSIHTVVTDGSNQAFEIQVRTFDMHADSELGVAAHWRYKEGAEQDVSYEARITWLRALIDWQKQSGRESNDESTKALRESVIDERVYVFTPNGDVIDIPKGSTVLDFAYNVHTMVGHRCRGVKVNGKIVPLTHGLETGDQVQILTNKEPSPSKDWMNQKLGYVYSAKIRSRISRWFKAQYKNEYSKLGKEKIFSELKGKKLKKINYTEVAKYFNMSDDAVLFAAVHVGDLRFNQVINYLLSVYALPDSESNAKVSLEVKKINSKHEFGCSMIVIHGIDGLMSSIAGCCKAVLGDEISGYITKGRGISVHRSTCKNFLRMKGLVPDRVIDVQWGRANTTKYLVDLKVVCLEENVIRGVYGLLSSSNVSLINSEEAPVQDDCHAQIIMRVAVSDLNEIGSMVAKIKSIKNILSVKRL